MTETNIMNKKYLARILESTCLQNIHRAFTYYTNLIRTHLCSNVLKRFGFLKIAINEC